MIRSKKLNKNRSSITDFFLFPESLIWLALELQVLNTFLTYNSELRKKCITKMSIFYVTF